MDKKTHAEQQPGKKKSILVLLGVLMVFAGISVPIPLTNAAREMQPGALKAVAFISADLFRAGAFFGIGFILIGILRNRSRA
jgi:hypothetical protein